MFDEARTLPSGENSDRQKFDPSPPSVIDFCWVSRFRSVIAVSPPSPPTARRLPSAAKATERPIPGSWATSRRLTVSQMRVQLLQPPPRA